jgi:hypothetical protein
MDESFDRAFVRRQGGVLAPTRGRDRLRSK